MFFVERLIVVTAGITFVIGIQYASEWLEEENLGMAEGICAGVGNAGAVGGALTLSRVFGADWSGPLFQSNWRAALLYTGVVSILLAIAYYVLDEAAPSKERRQAVVDNVTLKQWVHTATRYGTVVFAFAYVMSFGLELPMDGWLVTYYRKAFNTGNLVLTSMFAATFSIAAGLLRPTGGYVSDVLAREEMDILSVFEGRYREQSASAALSFIVVSMLVMTPASLSGTVLVMVAAGPMVGMACAFAEGAIFAQVPAMFPNSSGVVAGVVGGVDTIGGVTYPLVYSSVLLSNLHVDYVLAVATMVPIVLLNTWMYHPHITKRVTVGGLLGSPDSTGPVDN